MKLQKTIGNTLSFYCVFIIALNAQAEDDIKNCDNLRQFTFAWQFVDQCNMRPRGGTSRGAELQLDKSPSQEWLALQEEGLSDFERDRRAILAMTGPYRVSFDFLETVGYTPEFIPTQPYQSWGTEYVYLVEDSGDFISLQHIMVMYYQDGEGATQGPIVQKHWRQDWQYEKRRTMTYTGHRSWQQKKYSRKQVKGAWAQSVFQVDDSPRYEAVGKWQHTGNVSTWLSDETWRPLPRREFSVRNDYQALIGSNRHTITPAGWVQEEENLKTVLDENGKPVSKNAYLAKELGVARYERIKDFNFSAGDTYWENTAGYWRAVRNQWDNILTNNHRIQLKGTFEGQPMFMPFFTKAEEFNSGQTYDAGAADDFIEQTLQNFIVND